jgi:aminopeptidase N
VTSDLTQAEAATRAGLIEVSAMAVTLDLSTNADTFRSKTRIEFGCREPGTAAAGTGTFADLDAVAVREILLNGRPLDPGSIADGRLPLPGLTADNVLMVDGEFAGSRSGAGLAGFTDPADGSAFVLVSCFPTAAPSVFCCFDQPGLRADLTLTVTAPAGWECVASGQVLERPAEGTGGTWRFATVRAVQACDLTLCAGPYVTARRTAASASAPECTVRCRPTLVGSPGLAAIAEIVSRAIGCYQDLLGVPCPYDKVDIVFAPELGPTAMQYPAVMYVSEKLLQRAANPADDFVAMVLAHEGAHLWFGSLVEPGWWDDLWLAEAMASYLSYLACTQALGQPDAWAEFAMTGEAAAYQADSLPDSRPVSSSVQTGASALTRPAAITYNKGAAVIRQLAALIGDDAMRAGLRDYLTRFAWSAASLTDMAGCWSRASGRDLGGWARQWFTEPGVTTLRPELDLAADGTIRSAAVLQDPPLRQHRVALGAYQHSGIYHEGARLTRARLVSAELSGPRTEIPELAGQRMPAALVLNEGDLTFARVRFDEQSLRALVASAVTLGDPLTEAVCWNALWDMVTSAEFGAAEFTELVAGRIRRDAAGRPGSCPAATTEQLLTRAATAANLYAGPGRRARLRQALAVAVLDAADQATAGSRLQQILGAGFAACADSPDQLAVLRAWLDRTGSPQPPPGLRTRAVIS